MPFKKNLAVEEKKGKKKSRSVATNRKKNPPKKRKRQQKNKIKNGKAWSESSGSVRRDRRVHRGTRVLVHEVAILVGRARGGGYRYRVRFVAR